jgi:hypothetical protein
MTTMSARQKASMALLSLPQPVDQARNVLAKFPWDSSTELMLLSVRHVENALDQFVAARIPATEVEHWANAVEGRDDIGFESAHELLLRGIVHELANPLLTQALTRASAIELLERIGSRSDRRT